MSSLPQKVLKIMDNLGYKTSSTYKFKEFGEFVGVPGDWISAFVKKSDVTMTDVQRLIKIATKTKTPLDWFFTDTAEDGIVYESDLADDDILVLLNRIQERAQQGNCKFNGTAMNNDICKLVIDSIDVVKKMIYNSL